MNWDIIADNLPLYAQGARLTIILTVVSLAIGFGLSLELAPLRNSANPWISVPVLAYTLIFRSTPLLAQLFLIYFGLAQFDLLRASILWPWLSSPLFCVLLTFVLNTTAYTTEIFAGGLRHLPPGEIEAARAYGLGPFAIGRRIMIPAMLTRSLALYGNEAIMMMHATSLASTVTLLEVTGVARNITLKNFPKDPNFDGGIGGGIRKDDTKLKAEFDDGIRAIYKSGEFQTLAKKYFKFDVATPPT